MTDGDVPNPPRGWACRPLQDLCTKITDGTHKTPSYQPQGVRFISIKNVKPFKPIDWDAYTKFIRPEDSAELRRRCDPEYDDILFPRIGTLGYAKRVDFHEEVSLFVGLGLLKPDKALVEPKYLEYYMNTPWITELSHRRATGSGRLTLALEQTRRLPVLLAPRAEQVRVVEALDSYLTRLDDAAASLERARAKLKAYRASVLKASVEGRLVPTEASLARAGKRDYEPADALLARLLEERRRRWEETELARLKGAGKEPEGDKWKARYRVPMAPDTSVLPELPEGWCWATSDQMFWFITSGSRGWAKHYSESGSLFIRIGNLDHESISLDLSEVQYVSPPDRAEGTRTRVAPGDVLISITADVGMIAVAQEGLQEAYINQHVSLARPVPGFCTPYLAWFLAAAEGGQKQLRALQRGATKAGLGLDDIRTVNVPLPPLSEQCRIVDEVERLLSVATDCVLVTVASGHRLNRLRQSILNWAFEGKLVDQDPRDEPAATLLDRIQAERVLPVEHGRLRIRAEGAGRDRSE